MFKDKAAHVVELMHSTEQNMIVLVSHSTVFKQEMAYKFPVKVKGTRKSLNMAQRELIVHQTKLLVHYFSK